MNQYRDRMTKAQLLDLYKDRDVETELRYMAEHIMETGYFRTRDTDFIRWLCYAALDRIRGTE